MRRSEFAAGLGAAATRIKTPLIVAAWLGAVVAAQLLSDPPPPQPVGCGSPNCDWPLEHQPDGRRAVHVGRPAGDASHSGRQSKKLNGVTELDRAMMALRAGGDELRSSGGNGQESSGVGK